MSASEEIRLHYPLPIAKLYESMDLEGEPQLRVQKQVHLFEGAAQYLALVGLAAYNQLGLSNQYVDEMRANLGRPSLGHWVGLLKNLFQILPAHEPGAAYIPNLNLPHQDDAVIEAARMMAQMVGLKSGFQKIPQSKFLDTMVEFRNKKFGHGSLALGEAKQIVGSLGAALAQWLETILLLQNQHLLYLARVEWQDPQYAYTGTFLNAGVSLNPFRLDRTQPLTPNQVYLHHPDDDSFLALHPFFNFHQDTRLLCVYSELSNRKELILKCPYETSGADTTLTLNLDAALIIGDRPAPVAKPKPKARRQTATDSIETKETPFMRNWFDIISPHADIRQGHFDEAVFAADVGDVADGKAPADYNDPYLFYKKTYLTNGLTNLLTRVHDKLTHGQGSGVVQIQTPFGGGKTHALVTIYHYLQHGDKVQELLPANMPPSPFGRGAGGEGHLAVVAGNHWEPLTGRTTLLSQAGRGAGGEGFTRHTFWGDVAYQIGGQAGYDAFRENDQKRISPGKEKLRNFLEAHQPFVLLFDEILEYVNRVYDVRGKMEGSLATQTFSFFQELTEAVATLPKGMLVVTLPSSHLEDFGEQEEESLARLGKIFGRLESIETPVRGEEIYAVIRRLLFEVETLRQREMKETVHQYFQLYQQNRDDLPPKARDVNYKDKMEMAYPFHPDLIDILMEKWSTFASFQRTRGVLRLLANIIEDLYQRESNIDLIMPGDINLGKPGIRQEFLKHIGVEYEGVITSDIAGIEAKAQALDKANRQWKHLAQRIANAIFFHSFSADDSEKGATLSYIKLAVLHSGGIPALVTDVLQKLNNELWYLNNRVDVYYFSRIPNLNRMILDKKELFNQTYEVELRSIIDKEIGRKLAAYLWPDSNDAIADNRSLKLIILRPEDDGSQIPAWIERKGQAFREYQNTLFFALADTAAFAKMREDVKTYLALQEIEAGIKSGDTPQLETKKDEIQRRLRDLKRDFSYNVRRMYHTLQFGQRKLDLGQPTAGSEDMSTWYWRELTDGNVGAIVEQLGYRIIVNKLLAENDQVATSVILDQFYKNPDLPVPAQPEVVTRAIQLGIHEKALGLTEMSGDELDPYKLKYGKEDDVPLTAISFEPGVYVVSAQKAEELLAKIPPPPTLPGLEDEQIQVEPPEEKVVAPTPTTPTPAADKYKRVRLIINDIPAGKIADVNRGVLLPLSSLVKDMKFKLEIDVTSQEGVPKATLENKIKETIRQIGAWLSDETLE
jgi:hypothetical protein